MSCSHYIRWTQPVCTDCNKNFPCHFCHNDNCDHTMNRNKTKYMKCLLCNCYQSINSKCINPDCYAKEHYNTCLKCSLWCNKKRSIYHCDKCNFCRVGKQNDYKHCDKCNMCLKNEFYDSHVCTHDNINSDCPICLDHVWCGQSAISTLKCGHIMHQDCLQQYFQANNYNCPLCSKSLFDMSNHWKEIESYVNTNQMPDEYKLWKSNILCSDCNKKSITHFHFVYHKCDFCNSWNTKVNNVIKI